MDYDKTLELERKIKDLQDGQDALTAGVVGGVILGVGAGVIAGTLMGTLAALVFRPKQTVFVLAEGGGELNKLPVDE